MAIEGTTDQFPERTRSRTELLARAREVGWYHTLRLDESLTTPGIFALDEFQPFYLLPPSLRGLRCLEVGTGNGYWAFQMEQRGAASVTATDIGDYYDVDFSLIHGQPHPCPHRAQEGVFGEPYRIAATLLDSKVEYRIRNIYDIRPESDGTFDFVFCSSVLMHVFSPVIALRRLADVCRSTCVVTTQTEPLLDGEPLARFRGHEIPYVHFIPSPTCLGHMLQGCGYELVLRGPTFHLQFRDRASNPDKLPHTTYIAVKDAARPAIDLPPRALVGEGERSARIEQVWSPASVAPGQEFSLILRVMNESRVGWRGDGEGQAFRVTGTVGLQSRGRRGGVPEQAPFVDYLPNGVSTLVRVRLTAPLHEGLLELRPAVMQGVSRFASNDLAVVIPVMIGGGSTVSPFQPAEGRRFERARRAARAVPGYGVARTIVKKVLSPRS